MATTVHKRECKSSKISHTVGFGVISLSNTAANQWQRKSKNTDKAIEISGRRGSEGWGGTQKKRVNIHNET